MQEKEYNKHYSRSKIIFTLLNESCNKILYLIHSVCFAFQEILLKVICTKFLTSHQHNKNDKLLKTGIHTIMILSQKIMSQNL